MQEQIRIATALDNILEKLTGAIKKAYVAEGKAKAALEQATLDFARSEEQLSRLYQAKAYEIVMDDEWEAASIDPRVSEKTQTWAEMVIERLLKKDEDWNNALGDHYDLQQAATTARADALEAQGKASGLHEELGAWKNRTLLRTALLNAMSPESRSL